MLGYKHVATQLAFGEYSSLPKCLPNALCPQVHKDYSLYEIPFSALRRLCWGLSVSQCSLINRALNWKDELGARSEILPTSWGWSKGVGRTRETISQDDQLKENNPRKDLFPNPHVFLDFHRTSGLVYQKPHLSSSGFFPFPFPTGTGAVGRLSAWQPFYSNQESLISLLRLGPHLPPLLDSVPKISGIITHSGSKAVLFLFSIPRWYLLTSHESN